MADISEGFDGTVNEGAMARIFNAATDARIEAGGAISVIAGQRRILLGPIETHHAFIRHQNTEPIAFDIPAPTAGRWHLLHERRDWNNNRVTTALMAGPATSNDRNTISLPPTYPGDFKDQAGVLLDTPLYWVWVRNTDNFVLTVPIVRGRPYLAQSGSHRTENSGIVNAKDDARVLGLQIPNPMAAGTMLHLRGQAEIYCPAGNYGGFLHWRRELPGVNIDVAEQRWHTHGDRGQRWLFPVADNSFLISEDTPAGASFGLYVSNDPLSSGGVEMWFPSASWFTY